MKKRKDTFEFAREQATNILKAMMEQGMTEEDIPDVVHNIHKIIFGSQVMCGSYPVSELIGRLVRLDAELAVTLMESMLRK